MSRKSDDNKDVDPPYQLGLTRVYLRTDCRQNYFDKKTGVLIPGETLEKDFEAQWDPVALLHFYEPAKLVNPENAKELQKWASGLLPNQWGPGLKYEKSQK